MSPWLLVGPVVAMWVMLAIVSHTALSVDGRALVWCTSILVATLVIGFGAAVTAIKELR